MRSMRTLVIALAVAIAAVVGVSLGFTPAAAQETAAKDVPIIIATLDVPTLFTTSKAGKGLVAELKKRSKSTSEEMSTKEKALSTRKKQLDVNRASMPKAEYDKQMAALQKDSEAFRKEATQKRRALSKAQEAGYDQIRKVLDVVIKDIADKRGLTLIVDRSAVVLGADEWDITSEVKKALDAKLPAVKI